MSSCAGKTPFQVAAEDEREAMVTFLGTLHIQKQVPNAEVQVSWEAQAENGAAPRSAKRGKS